MKNMFKLLSILIVTSTVIFGSITDDTKVITDKYEGAQTVTVKGDSMVPMFRNNDVLVILPMAQNQIKKGMVCVYRNNLNELVAHTVTSVNPLKFKGMNNKKIDTDECVEILGVMYGIVNNWENESVGGNKVVLAKKY